MNLDSRKNLIMHFQHIAYLLLLGLLFSACTSTSTEKENQANREGDGYVRQSLQYMYAGRLDEALISVKTAIDINPKSADAYTVAALVYNKNNQPDLAEKYFKHALEIDPNNSAAQTNYASFLCKHDKPREAEKLFISSAKNRKNAQPDIAYTNAGLCVLGIPDTQKSKVYFEKAIEINTKSPIAIYQLSKIHYTKYEYQEAYEMLKRYESMAQPTPRTLLLGIQISEALKKPQMANQYKTTLAQKFPNSNEAKQVSRSISSPITREQPAVFDARNFLDQE